MIDDAELIKLWAKGHANHTQKLYNATIARFKVAVRKPLCEVARDDIDKFIDAAVSRGLKPGTCYIYRRIIALFFQFGQSRGYLPSNMTNAPPISVKDDGGMIHNLTESEIQKLLSHESNLRNYAILLLLCVGGKISELSSLRWRDVRDSELGGQLTLHGKGLAKRTVLLPAYVHQRLKSLHCNSSDDQPVFRSQKHGRLGVPQIWRIVQKSAKRIGIKSHIRSSSFSNVSVERVLNQLCGTSIEHDFTEKITG